MALFDKIKDGEKVLIGMIHCLPLPGTLGSQNTIEKVIERAVSDAKVLEAAGFDAVMVENEDKGTMPNLSKVQCGRLSLFLWVCVSAV